MKSSAKRRKTSNFNTHWILEGKKPVVWEDWQPEGIPFPKWEQGGIYGIPWIESQL